jgi:two-component system OmpR family response regulator
LTGRLPPPDTNWDIRLRMSDRPHILVVDDDREIRALLGDYLEKNGYRATAAADGKSMRRALEHARVDLIVLDLMLPGEDGLQLCRSLRVTSQVPIVMLTARGEDVDRILGLELGADDYLAKPFNPRELLVRIKAVLRRSVHAPRDPDPLAVRGYRFAGWRLDTTTRSLNREDGTTSALSGAEFRLLCVLLAHPSRVMSRMQLMELARGRDLDPFDRSIDVRISRLRQILGDDARSPNIIKTVYGEGYVVGVKVETE